ncbi:MAG: FAD:protein FMN transferase [Prevotella sp.]|nr:FAD:protein FMN transferase [Prevotella sp.]
MTNNRNKRLIWQIPFLVLLIVGTVLIIRQQQSTPYQKNAGLIFGTTYSVTYQYGEDLQKEIEAELKKVDADFSMFNSQSLVARLNNGENPELSSDFIDVFKLARQVSEDTDGAFDITVAPLVNAWGFGFKNEQMPTKEQVDSLRQLIGYQHVILKDKTITMQKPGMMLDFSAIAKGYGVDVVARLLERHDIKNYMVEIGGEITTRGINPERVPWRIGVNKPNEDALNESHELQTILNVTDKAMATSGNYRNFYVKGGKKYAHTIDPKTGYPVQHTLLSATVLTDRCAKADAYATSFMVLGMDGAKQILERHKELMAYLIFTDRKGNLTVWYSPSLKDKIVK